MANSFQTLPINADRICEAISKIGYKPSAAILDIVDNSIVAKAKKIIIQLYIKEGMTINNRQNLERILVIDDGTGMDDDGLMKALELGSNVEYDQNSLSKYGLGLKSAGFSLGKRIQLASKLEGESPSDSYFLDRKLIKEKNEFGYDIEDLSDKEREELAKIEKGTIVTIKELSYTSNVSAGRIIEDIAEKGGVSYFEYLKENGAKIIIQVLKSKDSEDELLKEKVIEPKDILFWEEAYEKFEKESYDGKKPCKALDTSFENPLDSEGEKILIKAAIFPKDSMKNHPSFSEEEQKAIKSYNITLKNSGFYFYRNGRLMKWGEKLFLNREFGFRATISFTTSHDDLFDVDVSKQHLTISEEVESVLQALVQRPRSDSKEVFKICNELIEAEKNKGNEGSKYNKKNVSLEEEKDETSDQIETAETLERQKAIEKHSSEIEGEESEKYESDDDSDVFRKIRYWDKGRNLWESASDRIEGTYVLINKLHPFYDLVLNRMENGSPERQSLEALFHSLAIGQNQTMQKFQDVEFDVVKKMYDLNNRYISNQLDNWVNHNWDLFEDED